MFIARLRPLYYISDKVIVRSLRNSRLSVQGPNPGLNRRIKAFKEDGLKLDDEDAEEFIERSESDFKNVSFVPFCSNPPTSTTVNITSNNR